MNVLRAAERHGVRKFIVTGSVSVNFGDPTVQDDEYRAERKSGPLIRSAIADSLYVDWSPLTKDAIYLSPMLAYQTSKKYAELAIWEWSEAHPHVDVTVSA